MRLMMTRYVPVTRLVSLYRETCHDWLDFMAQQNTKPIYLIRVFINA